jgi:hypothetical protein
MFIARLTLTRLRGRTARRLAATAGALGALALVPAAAMAAPGDLDTSFGAGRGFVTTDVVTNSGFLDDGRAVAVGPFGDAYVAGTSFVPGGSQVLSLAAYTCCDLNPTFGTRGTVALQAGSGVTGNDVLYDNRGDGDATNDRILVARDAGGQEPVDGSVRVLLGRVCAAERGHGEPFVVVGDSAGRRCATSSRLAAMRFTGVDIGVAGASPHPERGEESGRVHRLAVRRCVNDSAAAVTTSGVGRLDPQCTS